MRFRALRTLAGTATVWAAMAVPVLAQAPQRTTIDIDGIGAISAPLQVVLMLTLLSFIPAILMTMTAFTRIVIVLAILRQALGTPQTPPNQRSVRERRMLAKSVRSSSDGDGDANRRAFACSNSASDSAPAWCSSCRRLTSSEMLMWMLLGLGTVPLGTVP